MYINSYSTEKPMKIISITQHFTLISYNTCRLCRFLPHPSTNFPNYYDTPTICFVKIIYSISESNNIFSLLFTFRNKFCQFFQN